MAEVSRCLPVDRPGVNAAMSMNSSVDIKFHLAIRVTDIVNCLLKAGWCFPDGSIVYEHYRSIEDIGDWQEAPQQQLQQVQLLLEEKMENGETVAISLGWRDIDVVIKLIFNSTTDLTLFLPGSKPLLANCKRFTDFSWLLSRVLCPLIENKYIVLEVECLDNNR